MKLREPNNFEDILRLQAILDRSMNNTRFRTLRDIKLSLIAEVIEFNEETPESHKTWKTKKHSKEKELEELTDIWFFLAQMVNFKLENSDSFVETKNKIMKRFEEGINLKSDPDADIENLISYALYGNVLRIAENLLVISYNYGYTKNDILKTYWEKWQKNMQRIGKEWN